MFPNCKINKCCDSFHDYDVNTYFTPGISWLYVHVNLVAIKGNTEQEEMLTGSLQRSLTVCYSPPQLRGIKKQKQNINHVSKKRNSSTKKKKLKYYFTLKYMLDFNKAEFTLRTISSAFTLGKYSFKGSIALKSLVNLKIEDQFYPLPCCPLLTKGWEPLPDTTLS